MSPRWVRCKALLPMLPIVGVIVVFAVMAWQYRWMSDDGLIHLRVVRQIQAGHGPVFNPGARVEVTTSIAWVAALVVLDLLIPAPREWIAVITGIETSTYWWMDDAHDAAIVTLFVMMGIKFFMILLWFMHLKFDSKLFSLLFYLGLFLAVGVYMVTLFTFQFFA